MMRLLAGLAALALLGGCVLRNSQPARLYVLDAVAVAGSASAPTGPMPVLGVQRVSVPAWIDRGEIAERAAAGGISVDPTARWAEPIGRGLQRVMVDNLAALLPERHLVAAPFTPRQVVDLRLEISFTEAARQADGSVLVDARWRILGTAGATRAHQRSSHRVTPAAGAAGTVRGLSEALALLSGEIAAAVRALPVDGPPAEVR